MHTRVYPKVSGPNR